MRRLLPLLFAAAAVAVAVAVAGCSGSAETVEEAREVTVAIAGTPQMNAGGNAVVLQIYQLSDADPFTIIPVEEFWLDGDAAFAGTLVSRREVLLYPEEVRALPLVLDDRTTHVGVAADFRAPSLDGWRVVLPVPRVLADGLGVLVAGDSLVVTGPAVAAPAPAAPTPAATADSTRAPASGQ